MRFVVAIILTALFAAISGLYLPFWGIAIAAFIVSFVVNPNTKEAVLAGFLGVFLAWASLAFWIDFRNAHFLASQMANYFHLYNYLLLIIFTGIVGGIVGASAAWSANLLRNIKQ